MGIYFVFYQDSRIEQTTVRNFRALDAASLRLAKMIEQLPVIINNVPVGVSPDMFEDILTEMEVTGNLPEAVLKAIAKVKVKALDKIYHLDEATKKEALEEIENMTFDDLTAMTQAPLPPEDPDPDADE